MSVIWSNWQWHHWARFLKAKHRAAALWVRDKCIITNKETDPEEGKSLLSWVFSTIWVTTHLTVWFKTITLRSFSWVWVHWLDLSLWDELLTHATIISWDLAFLSSKGGRRGSHVLFPRLHLSSWQWKQIVWLGPVVEQWRVQDMDIKQTILIWIVKETKPLRKEHQELVASKPSSKQRPSLLHRLFTTEIVAEGQEQNSWDPSMLPQILSEKGKMCSFLLDLNCPTWTMDAAFSQPLRTRTLIIQALYLYFTSVPFRITSFSSSQMLVSSFCSRTPCVGTLHSHGHPGISSNDYTYKILTRLDPHFLKEKTKGSWTQ